MAATMRVCRVQASRPAARTTVVVQASVDRRSVLTGLFAGAAALLAAPQDAQAIKIASQNFTGGMVTGGGSSPKSATAASMESYDMEGTKKQGISIKKKKKVLASVRERAVKAASK